MKLIFTRRQGRIKNNTYSMDNGGKGASLMARKKDSIFISYQQKLPEADQTAISDFFTELHTHISIDPKERAQIREDFEKALLYYDRMGIPLAIALERLTIDNLGGFYARPPILWYGLDDAAKIYPLSMKHGQMSVFRLSVYFTKPVIPELLQMALTFTIKRFPSFATTVKKGFFWHYLDATKRRYCIQEEFGIPCRPLKIFRSGSQSFRVLYYNNRMSVEYFHVLTDGTGGMVFLKTLAAEYLRLAEGVLGQGEGVLDINGTPAKSEVANEFPRVSKVQSGSQLLDKSAVQMGGKLSRRKPCRVLHYKMDVSRLRQAAKARGATITAYILALLFVAGKYATDLLEGDANIQVPVNLRKFYDSETLRNFSMYCGIRLPMEKITDVNSILGEITFQLTEKAAKQNLDEMVGTIERMVYLLRYVPLFIKTPIAKIIYGFAGDNSFSNTLSNLGVVKMPPELEGYIDSMDFVLGTAQMNRAGCSMVTFGNIATLSISKMTADPSFEEKLVQLLKEDGIQPVIEGSDLYEN